MNALSNRDFAALLDELIRAAETGPEAVRPPAMPCDFLATTATHEVEPGRAVSAEYFDALAVLDEIRTLPSIEPEAVAEELGIAAADDARDFDQMRRDFAFRNHPDRVAPELRERAMIRMQIANRLIDEAKRRALAVRGAAKPRF